MKPADHETHPNLEILTLFHDGEGDSKMLLDIMKRNSIGKHPLIILGILPGKFSGEEIEIRLAKQLLQRPACDFAITLVRKHNPSEQIFSHHRPVTIKRLLPQVLWG